MKFVVTGCTSFIGVNLVCMLLNEGHQVIGVCRNIEKASLLLPKHLNLEVICLEMDRIQYLTDKISSNIDVFIHLAWNGADHDGRNDETIQMKNVEQSLVALMVGRKLKCKLFVEAGSQAEYGLIKGLLTPDTRCFPENEYGKAKLEFGLEAESICRNIGMKFLHLRILSIYGEGDKDWTLIISCIKKMLRNEDVPLSLCLQNWNYVYIKDAVKQIYLLCQYALNNELFKSEVFLIGSKDTRPLRNFIEEMYSLTGSKSRLLYGFYTPLNIVELNPDMSKTEIATNGFISNYTFEDGIKTIIKSMR